MPSSLSKLDRSGASYYDGEMETRIGGVTLIVKKKESVDRLNHILSEYGPIIRGRMGIPFIESGISVISLIVEGSTDDIGAMTGKIGRLEGVEARSVLAKEIFSF